MLQGLFFGMTDELIFGTIVDTKKREYTSKKTKNSIFVKDSDDLVIAAGGTQEGTHIVGLGPYAKRIEQEFKRGTIRSLESLFNVITLNPYTTLHGYMDMNAYEDCKDIFPNAQIAFTPRMVVQNVIMKPGKAQGLVYYKNQEIKPYEFGIRRVNTIDELANFIERRIVPEGSVAIIGYEGVSGKVYPKVQLRK